MRLLFFCCVECAKHKHKHISTCIWIQYAYSTEICIYINELKHNDQVSWLTCYGFKCKSVRWRHKHTEKPSTSNAMKNVFRIYLRAWRAPTTFFFDHTHNLLWNSIKTLLFLLIEHFVCQAANSEACIYVYLIKQSETSLSKILMQLANSV